MNFQDALKTLVEPEIACRAGPIEAFSGILDPKEESLVANAVEKRHREFRAGRYAARDALVQLGRSPQPILAAKDRQPIWPDGMTGSISHSDSHVAVLAAHANNWAGLGVDIEPDTPIKDAVAMRILRPEERGEPQFAKLIFAIKEAGYKALYPRYGRFIGFEDARTKIEGDVCGAFEIEMLLSDWEGPDLLQGRWTRSEGHWMAAVSIPNP